MKASIVALTVLLCAALPAAGQEPICIVDGVRVPPSVCGIAGATAARLDPKRVESVEVLKGAAARSAYGADATAGVIVITTKPGSNIPFASEDPLARYLLPPELVMAHQQAIGLTDRQRAAIQQSIRDAQARFVDLQFAMAAEVESLQRLIERSSPDEARVLAQVDRVLEIEREVKHAQLSLMIRIKNVLTPQQAAELERLRGKPR